MKTLLFGLSATLFFAPIVQAQQATPSSSQAGQNVAGGQRTKVITPRMRRAAGLQTMRAIVLGMIPSENQSDDTKRFLEKFRSEKKEREARLGGADPIEAAFEGLPDAHKKAEDFKLQLKRLEKSWGRLKESEAQVRQAERQHNETVARLKQAGRLNPDASDHRGDFF